MTNLRACFYYDTAVMVDILGVIASQLLVDPDYPIALGSGMIHNVIQDEYSEFNFLHFLHLAEALAPSWVSSTVVAEGDGLIMEMVTIGYLRFHVVKHWRQQQYHGDVALLFGCVRYDHIDWRSSQLQLSRIGIYKRYGTWASFKFLNFKIPDELLGCYDLDDVRHTKKDGMTFATVQTYYIRDGWAGKKLTWTRGWNRRRWIVTSPCAQLAGMPFCVPTIGVSDVVHCSGIHCCSEWDPLWQDHPTLEYRMMMMHQQMTGVHTAHPLELCQCHVTIASNTANKLTMLISCHCPYYSLYNYAYGKSAKVLLYLLHVGVNSGIEEFTSLCSMDELFDQHFEHFDGAVTPYVLVQDQDDPEDALVEFHMDGEHRIISAFPMAYAQQIAADMFQIGGQVMLPQDDEREYEQLPKDPFVDMGADSDGEDALREIRHRDRDSDDDNWD